MLVKSHHAECLAGAFTLPVVTAESQASLSDRAGQCGAQPAVGSISWALRQFAEGLHCSGELSQAHRGAQPWKCPLDLREEELMLQMHQI